MNIKEILKINVLLYKITDYLELNEIINLMKTNSKIKEVKNFTLIKKYIENNTFYFQRINTFYNYNELKKEYNENQDYKKLLKLYDLNLSGNLYENNGRNIPKLVYFKYYFELVELKDSKHGKIFTGGKDNVIFYGVKRGDLLIFGQGNKKLIHSANIGRYDKKGYVYGICASNYGYGRFYSCKQ
jgi:hypothetical protein